MLTPRRTAVLLLIVTALLYAPTLTYGFVYEDVHDLQSWSRSFAEARTLWVWHPARSLTEATFLLTYQAFGLWPGAYHVGNVLIHLLNGGVLYGLAASCLRPWPAVFALGVFLLHPVQVESVAYIANRPDLLATTALLVGLHAVIARRWWLVGVAGVAAFLAKETAVMAVPVFGLVALWRGEWLSRLQRIGALVLCVPLATYLALSYPITFDLRAALLSLTAFTRLLAFIVWPVGLSIEHDWNWITTIPMSLIAGLWVAALTWAYWRRETWLALAIGWCALVIAPRFLVPLAEGLHEHHLYACMVVLSLLTGALLSAESTGYGISTSRT